MTTQVKHAGKQCLAVPCVLSSYVFEETDADIKAICPSTMEIEFSVIADAA
jgi:hypothetical protein